MPEISGYHHLNLTVPDLEKSVEWYSQVLGFEKLREMSDEGWRKVILTRSENQLILGLTAHTSGDGEPFQETTRTGVGHSPIKQGAMGDLIVFRDPDNIQLEVYAGA